MLLRTGGVQGSASSGLFFQDAVRGSGSRVWTSGFWGVGGEGCKFPI